MAMRDAAEAQGKPSFWSPPQDATPEQLAEFERYMAKVLVPDDSITAWIDVGGDPTERKWRALREHRTQIALDSTFMLFGLDGWQAHWSKEAFILCESHVPTANPEDDLFAGIVG
jgi:hypothetical protein